MTIRTNFLALAERLRARTGVAGFDIRTTRLAIVTRVWSGGRRGAPAPSSATPRYVDSVLELPQIYKVRQVATSEVGSSGGKFEKDDILVGPITPAFTTEDGTQGGFTEAQLNPVVTRHGTEIVYVLSGAHAGEYQLIELRSTHALHYKVMLGRRETTP